MWVMLADVFIIIYIYSMCVAQLMNATGFLTIVH
jgi:hypothetical protein